MKGVPTSVEILNQTPFVGLEVSELQSGSIATAKLGLQYKLAKKTYLTGLANAAIYDFHEVSFKYLSTKNNFLSGYGLSFGYYSPIGPLDLTVMYCDQDAMVRNYVNIGFNF